jgi:NADH:ubiquinone oxidoreductase subunit C
MAEVEGPSDEEWGRRLQRDLDLDIEWIGGSIPVIESPPSQVLRVLTLLKENEDIQCTVLTDIIVVDRLAKDDRFEILYLVSSLANQKRAIVLSRVEEDDSVGSVGSLFEAANRLEKEATEGFGIFFRKRRPDEIARLAEGAEFPLRKDSQTRES